MSRASRAKGVRGEREVATIYEGHGLAVRGLEGAGDHLIVCAGGLVLHSETKRQEVLRIPLWLRQAIAEAPAGTVPVVHFRQNRDVWCVALRLSDFAEIVAAAGPEL